MTEQGEKRLLHHVFGIMEGQAAGQYILEYPLLKLIEKANNNGLELSLRFQRKRGRTSPHGERLVRVFGGQGL